jgi:hypothetical protein
LNDNKESRIDDEIKLSSYESLRALGYSEIIPAIARMFYATVVMVFMVVVWRLPAAIVLEKLRFSMLAMVVMVVVVTMPKKLSFYSTGRPYLGDNRDNREKAVCSRQ